ncbi:MAG: beta-mannanase, partial [Gorillibacterium sp.]|nr:beta-mannanase [Gorillibacterium sp.]
MGAFLLAKQAGFDIDFRFEDQPIPEASFYLLPCVTGVMGVAKQRWEQLLLKVHEGATLYISSNDGYMLNFAEITGLTVQNRSRRASEAKVLLGGVGEHTELTLPGTFKLEFSNDRAEILAAEPDGNPVLTKASYGKGWVYFCSLPLELAMSQQPGVSYQPDKFPFWRMYETISREVLNVRVLHVNEPLIGITEHPSDESSRIAVLINYSPEVNEVQLTLKAGWRLDESLYGNLPQERDGTILIKIEPNDAFIVKLSY